MKNWIKKHCTTYQRISLQYKYWKKGIPFYLLRRFRNKRNDAINTDKLYRRSKIHTSKEHWDETRLGEISCNWSCLCKKLVHVLLDHRLESNCPLYFEKFKRVAVCNLEEYNSLLADQYPFATILTDKEGNFLKIEIEHDPLDFNYSHVNVNCYLTTINEKFNNALVSHDKYDEHPLKKELRELRNKYKAHLMYHFSEYEDFTNLNK